MIIPTAEKYFAELHRALDVVSREKKYLAFLQAPPLADALIFYRHILANDFCQFIAIEGEKLIGWCDILPVDGESRAHVGLLAIAVLPDARGKGIGTRLMEAALAKVRSQGLTRIELIVRCDNQRAKALYDRFGFFVEGIQQRSQRVDGEYFDAYAMALLL